MLILPYTRLLTCHLQFHLQRGAMSKNALIKLNWEPGMTLVRWCRACNCKCYLIWCSVHLNYLFEHGSGDDGRETERPIVCLQMSVPQNMAHHQHPEHTSFSFNLMTGLKLKHTGWGVVTTAMRVWLCVRACIDVCVYSMCVHRRHLKL